ncbi:MAG TPA: PAS domain S-box protein, partial [Thermoplasmatales archaeon]|nr:PAS domain S-box protein [Thermoplasmatales archaeon]
MMFQFSEAYLWLIPIILIYLIIAWFIHLYLKDKDKRKLMFSISFLLASIDYILLFIDYPLRSNYFVYNIYQVVSIPLQISILIAVTEILYERKDFNKTFNLFIILTVVLLSPSPLPVPLYPLLVFIRRILAAITIILSVYSFIKTRKQSSIIFLLAMFSFSISGTALANNLIELSVFSHIMAYIFIVLIFASNLEYSGVESFFSLKSRLEATEEKLRRSERKYHTIVSSMSDTIFLIDREDRFIEIYCKPDAPLYRKPEEFIGKKYQDVMPEDISVKYIENAKKVRETGVSRQYEYILNINGENRWFEAILDLYGDGESILARVRDITDRKEMEEKLRESEERYRLTVENSSDAIMLTDSNGCISYLSPAGEKIFGYPIEDLIEKRISFIHSEDVDKLKKMYQLAVDGLKGSNYEYRVVTKNGDIKWVSHSWSPIYKNGKVNMTVSVIRDITEKKKMEEELKNKLDELEKARLSYLNILQDLKDTVDKLNAAREELTMLNKTLEDKVKERTKEVEKLLQQKDEFINQLSHDLKTPLTPLTTLLPIIQKQVDNPKTKELIDTVIQSTLYMKSLITKTLQLARLNSPNAEIYLEETNLLKEINNAIERNKTSLQEHNIYVESLVDGDILVNADKLHLGELLDNLISNAVKYTPDGGKITINVEYENDEVKVAIKDNGIGMTREQIEHIFDEFYKADESRHDLDSSGLGLAICKRIVE